MNMLISQLSSLAPFVSQTFSIDSKFYVFSNRFHISKEKPERNEVERNLVFMAKKEM
jgi:hypothetical protein